MIRVHNTSQRARGSAGGGTHRYARESSRRLGSLLCALLVCGLTAGLPASVSATTFSKSFAFTGDTQGWTVPQGITTLNNVRVSGAGGSTAPGGLGGAGGSGALVTVPSLSVTPNHTLSLIVGGGGRGDGAPGAVGAGGFGGGGNGSYAHESGTAGTDGGGGGGGGGYFLSNGAPDLGTFGGGGGGSSRILDSSSGTPLLVRAPGGGGGGGGRTGGGGGANAGVNGCSGSGTNGTLLDNNVGGGGGGAGGGTGGTGAASGTMFAGSAGNGGNGGGGVVPAGSSCGVGGSAGNSPAGSNGGDGSISFEYTGFSIGGSITGLTADGLILSLNTTPSQSVRPANGATSFTFPDGIGGGGFTISFDGRPPGLRCTVTNGTASNVTADVTNIQVNCVPLYTLTYNGNGNTGGAAPSDVNSPYPSGNSVTVLGNTGALVRDGYDFNGWNTAANGTGTPEAAGATFTITANTTLYAQWLMRYTITGTAVPAVGGTVTCVPAVVHLNESSACTASPSPGYTFSAFSGDCTGSTCSLTAIQSNKTVSATFLPTTSYSAATATGTGTATAAFTGTGGSACAYTQSQFVSAASVGVAPPPGYGFPHGLFAFTASNCTVGGALTITATYPQPIPAGAVFYKFGATSANPTPHWYVYPATISGNTITYTIIDGGAGDSNLASDGTLIDPAGAAVLLPPPVVPLSNWLMLLLAGLLPWMAWTRLERRRE